MEDQMPKAGLSLDELSLTMSDNSFVLCLSIGTNFSITFPGT